jgi:hypothetical protein
MRAAQRYIARRYVAAANARQPRRERALWLIGWLIGCS